VCNVLCKFPRDGDDWLMVVFQSLGYWGQQLMRLNWACKHHQVPFLLDVLGTGGRNINTWYDRLRTAGEQWYTLKFSSEAIYRQDFRLWKEELGKVVSIDREESASACIHGAQVDIRFGNGM
jgi:hypothetical protein